MKKMRLFFHSMVGAITNSSSEIYTWLADDAISIAKSHVKSYMELFDIPGSVDDMFEIEIEVRYERNDDGENDGEGTDGIITVVAKTDAEVHAVNQRIPTSTDLELPLPEDFAVTVRNKKTGKILDISDLGSMTRQESGYN